MLDRWRLKRLFRELERLGVPTDGGPLLTYDYHGKPLSLREILQCLAALPDGAGRDAVDRALNEAAQTRG